MANKHFGLWPSINPNDLGGNDLMLVGRAADSQIYRLNRTDFLTWLKNGGAVVMDVNGNASAIRNITAGGIVQSYSAIPEMQLVRTDNGRGWTMFNWNASNDDLSFGYLTGGGWAGNVLQMARDGFVKVGGRMSLGMSPIAGTSAVLHQNGDTVLAGANRSIMGNLYFTTGWRYAANGTGAAIIFSPNTANSLTLYVAPNNTAGAGASADGALIGAYTIPASGSPHWLPWFDGAQNLGAAGSRFGTVFASTGAISTSGRQAKRAIVRLKGCVPTDKDPERAMAARRLRVGARLAGRISSWQFADSILKKGQEAFDALSPEEQSLTTPEAEGVKVARYHVGWVFDEVVADFEAEGLDPYREAAVCRDKKMVRSTVQELGQVQEEIEESYDDVEFVVDPTNSARALRRKVTKTRKVPQWREVPAFDEVSGAPIMVPSGRFLDLTDSAGNPLPEMVQEKHRVPKMIPAMVPREVETWDGESYVEALRENHLYALCIAAMAAGITIEPEA